MMARGASLGTKFKDFTLVVVSYCSGDLHLGMVNSVLDDGSVLQQFGIVNFRAVLGWLTNQQQWGELSNSLSELVILGSSAGCYHALLLTNQITRSLRSKRTAAIIDSMELILPSGVLYKLFNLYGACRAFAQQVSQQVQQIICRFFI